MLLPLKIFPIWKNKNQDIFDLKKHVSPLIPKKTRNEIHSSNHPKLHQSKSKPQSCPEFRKYPRENQSSRVTKYITEFSEPLTLRVELPRSEKQMKSNSQLSSSNNFPGKRRKKNPKPPQLVIQHLGE